MGSCLAYLWSKEARMLEELAGDSARRATARETGGSAFPDLSRWAMPLTCTFTGPLCLSVLNDVGEGQKEARECS